MNFFQKAFCRCFQAVLRLALPILPYRSPRVLTSVGAIPGCLEEQNIQNVLVVTDGFLHISGMLEPLKKALTESGIRYTIYDEVVANPTVLNVELARERYVQNGCEALIGFGGGSSIDCGKAVGARIARPKKPIPKMRGILKVLKPIPFLIAVPTTAGTGSETTLATVITDDKNAYKFPINDFPLIPKVAVLDPEMTRSLPQNMTATTGIDALTHAIEAYIGRSTTRQTRADALEAVQLIEENLEKAYADGSDMTARANMLRAAFLAGGAFSKSYVGYCHAVAHSLGGQYHIAHGLQRGAAALCAGSLRPGHREKGEGYRHRHAHCGRRHPGGRGPRPSHWRNPPDESEHGHPRKAPRHSSHRYSQAGRLCRQGGQSAVPCSGADEPAGIAEILL